MIKIIYLWVKYAFIQMIHSIKYTVFYILVLLGFLSACKTKEIYSSIPLIEYKSAKFLRGSDGIDSIMILTFSFKDGDGDIGLNQKDTFPPFQPDRNRYNEAANPYYYNLHIDYFERFNNKFSQVIKELEPDSVPPVYDTLKYVYRVENITPDGRHKAIRGDIEVKIAPSPHPDAQDTVVYQFYLYDRNLNQSNVVRSPELIWKRE